MGYQEREEDIDKLQTKISRASLVLNNIQNPKWKYQKPDGNLVRAEKLRLDGDRVNIVKNLTRPESGIAGISVNLRERLVDLSFEQLEEFYSLRESIEQDVENEVDEPIVDLNRLVEVDGQISFKEKQFPHLLYDYGLTKLNRGNLLKHDPDFDQHFWQISEQVYAEENPWVWDQINLLLNSQISPEFLSENIQRIDQAEMMKKSSVKNRVFSRKEVMMLNYLQKYGGLNSDALIELTGTAKLLDSIQLIPKPYYDLESVKKITSGSTSAVSELRVELPPVHNTHAFVEKIRSLETIYEPQLKEVILHFFQHPEGRQITSLIRNTENKPKFSARLAGYLFEYFSYEWIKYLDNRRLLHLLSPNETLSIFTEVHKRKKEPETDKGKKESEEHHLTRGIAGVSLPDGIFFRETEEFLIIDKVLECKSSQDLDSIEQSRLGTQSVNFQGNNLAESLRLNDIGTSILLGSLIHQMRPEIPAKPVEVNPNAKLVLAIPQNSYITLPNTEIKYIPMHSRALSHIISAIREAS